MKDPMGDLTPLDADAARIASVAKVEIIKVEGGFPFAYWFLTFP